VFDSPACHRSDTSASSNARSAPDPVPNWDAPHLRRAAAHAPRPPRSRALVCLRTAPRACARALDIRQRSTSTLSSLCPHDEVFLLCLFEGSAMPYGADLTLPSSCLESSRGFGAPGSETRLIAPWRPSSALLTARPAPPADAQQMRAASVYEAFAEWRSSMGSRPTSPPPRSPMLSSGAAVPPGLLFGRGRARWCDRGAVTSLPD